ncbi:GNAT family N-acetyltransferase [Blastococcus haudaquaticus]|uniref:Acetyltransferase (GNAT) family protein n=1 Tax=Blastococcus haudaquaticus TaxID=1938745 RepID=A0A286GF72_9ACTN|nr:GNAT family N-acetyltransferase [Blastococcus haudaquaticus]SOD94167.1 Acetyltransferase (GNAT) family protein [Blastococcus haudaquaticus]
MSEPVVRPFRRADREQLTSLVNAHVATVVPGWALSTAALLAQIERDPGQYVTDPWVSHRLTLVAEADGRVVAAAHLRRYRGEADVGPDWRDAGEIAWLVHWPAAEAAGLRLAHACVRALEAWQARRQFADGDLPTPATYGIPDSWPHVARTLRAVGFAASPGRVETTLVGTLDGVPPPGAPPSPRLTLRRAVGTFGARFQAVADGDVIGFVEADDDHSRGGSLMRMDGWADLAELHVTEGWRRQGVGTWLVHHLVAWLRLGGTRRFLVAVGEDELPLVGWFGRFGWHPVGENRRGWERGAAADGPGRGGL